MTYGTPVINGRCNVNGRDAPSFVGILDELSPALALATVVLRGAMVGQNLFRLREDNGDTESSFAIASPAEDGSGTINNGSSQTPEAWKAAESATDLWLADWFDQSGNANHATQASSAPQPKYTSGTAITDSDAVLELGSTITATDELTLIGVGTPSSSQTMAMFGTSDANQSSFIRFSDGVLYATVGVGNYMAVTSSSNSPGVFVWRRSGSTNQFYRDGTLLSHSSPLGDGTGTVTLNRVLGNSVLSQYGVATFNALLAFTSALSNAQLNTICTYLATINGSTWSDIA